MLLLFHIIGAESDFQFVRLVDLLICLICEFVLLR